MIQVKSMSKSFDGTPVLEDVTLTMEDGHIYGLVGVNGCGGNHRLGVRTNLFGQLFAVFAMTASDADFRENFADGAALLDSDGGNGATTDNQSSCHFFVFPF